MLKSCQKTCQTISQSCDAPLGLWQRAKLKLHLMMCPSCRHYACQISAIQTAMAALRQQISQSKD